MKFKFKILGVLLVVMTSLGLAGVSLGFVPTSSPRVSPKTFFLVTPGQNHDGDSQVQVFTINGHTCVYVAGGVWSSGVALQCWKGK